MKKIFKIIVFILAAAVLPLFLQNQPKAKALETLTTNKTQLNLDKSYKDTLIVIGNDIKFSGTVDGDLYLIGQNVNYNGSTAGNLFALSRSLTVNGKIGKDLLSVTKKLSLTENADIKGGVKVAASQVIKNKNASIAGKYLAKKYSSYRQITFLGGLLQFLALIFTVLIISYFAPKSTLKVAKIGKEKWGVALLTGVVTVIAAPILIALLMVSSIGLPIAVLLAVCYGFSIYLSTAASGFVLGTTLIGEKTRPFLAFMLGTAIIIFLSSLQNLGAFVALISLIYGTGVIIVSKFRIYKSLKADL